MIKLNHSYAPRPIWTYLEGELANPTSLAYRIYRNGVAEADPESLVSDASVSTGLTFATLTTLGVADGWATTDHVLGIVDVVIDGQTYSTDFFDSSAIAAEGAQPYSSHAPQRVSGSKLTAFLGEDSDVSITVTAYDADGEPLTLTGLSLTLIIAAYDDPDTPLITPQTFTGSGSTFSLTLDDVVTAAEVLAGKAHHWSLRDGTEVIQRGRLEVVTTAAQGA